MEKAGDAGDTVRAIFLDFHTIFCTILRNFAQFCCVFELFCKCLLIFACVFVLIFQAQKLCQCFFFTLFPTLWATCCAWNFTLNLKLILPGVKPQKASCNSLVQSLKCMCTSAGPAHGIDNLENSWIKVNPTYVRKRHKSDQHTSIRKRQGIKLIPKNF